MLPRALRPLTPSLRANSFATSSKIPSTVPESTPSAPPAPATASTPPSDAPLDAAALDAAAPPPTAPAEPILDPGRNDKGYRAWLAGEGSRYRNGLPGQTNWLGDTPFPMNPSFAPLPPLADEVKTRIYNAYYHNITDSKTMSDTQVIRAVSAKFGVAMDRVRAIVRLKELEETWKSEKRTLQTALLKGMESHLGVKQVTEKWRGTEEPDRPLSQRSTGKTVFEMVDVESNDSPVFLPLLARVETEQTTTTKKVKSRSIVVPASRPGRAGTKFENLDGTVVGKELEESRFRGGKRVHKFERK